MPGSLNGGKMLHHVLFLRAKPETPFPLRSPPLGPVEHVKLSLAEQSTEISPPWQRVYFPQGQTQAGNRGPTPGVPLVWMSLQLSRWLQTKPSHN